MATDFIVLNGKSMWAQLKVPDAKFGDAKYKIGVILDAESKARFKSSGLRLQLKESDEGNFYTFSRPETKEILGKTVEFGPPIVVDSERNPIDDNVGNGSDVTIKVSVYDTRMGKGHRLEVVRVNRLVPFKGGSQDPLDGMDDPVAKKDKSVTDTAGTKFEARPLVVQADDDIPVDDLDQLIKDDPFKDFNDTPELKPQPKGRKGPAKNSMPF